MPDLETRHLVLHPVDLLEAERILGRAPAPVDKWAEDYPFEGDIVALTVLAAAWARDGEQRPFGYYRIDRRSDGRAIGGIGFKGRPVGGVVEVGYGLAPSGRGCGYATEALAALAQVAVREVVVRLCAEVELGNNASVRTLEHAGFQCTGEDAGLLQYTLAVG